MIAAISESNMNLPGGKRRCGDGKQGIRPQAWAGIRPVAGKGVQEMSVCKGCGAPIDWIKTTEGRNMPIDPEPVFIIEGGGTDRFVTDEGAVVLGRMARPDEESAALPVGFVPHWKTCPNAADFRRRR